MKYSKKLRYELENEIKKYSGSAGISVSNVKKLLQSVKKVYTDFDKSQSILEEALNFKKNTLRTNILKAKFLKKANLKIKNETRVHSEGVALNLKKINDKTVELIESISETKALIGSLGEGVVAVNEEGIIIEINKVGLNLLGFKKNELIGELYTYKILMEDEKGNYVPNEKRPLFKSLKFRRTIKSDVSYYIRKDGTKFPVSQIATPIRLDHKFKGSLVVFNDITQNKERTEKLFASEDQFRKIFENSMYGIILTGSDGKFFKLNKSFCKMLGYPEKELLGKKFSSVTYKEDVKNDVENFQKMVRGESNYYQTEKRYIKKNGDVIWVNLNGSVLRNVDKSFRYFIGMVEDVTKRKLLEEQLLKASTDRYRALFISSRDAVMTLEPPTWKFTSVNPAALDMYRAKNEKEFLKLGPWNVSPEFQPDGQSSAEKAKKMIEKAMREGSSFFEWTHKRLNGEEFSAEVLLSKVKQKEKTFLHAVVRDITERKLAQKKLAEYAEERFKVIFDNTNDGIVLADVKNRQLFICNASFSRMLGYNFEEILGLSVTDIHPKEILNYILGQFERQVRGEISLVEGVQVKRKDGSIFYADINSSVVNMGGKKYLLGIFRDITERKNKDEILRKLSEYNRQLLEVSLDPLVTIGKDGKITDSNKATELATGVSRNQLIGDDFSNYFTEPDKAKEGYKKVLELGFVKDYPLTIKHVSGRMTDVLYNATVYKNESGEIEGVFAAARDITESKLKEEELKKNEELFHSIVTTMDEGIIMHNKKGELILVNPSAEKILGLTAKDLEGTTLEQKNKDIKFIHTDGTVFLNEDHPAMIALKTGKHQSDIVLGVNKKNKDTVWVSINSEPLFSNHEIEPYAAVATLRDITREREIEKLRVDFLSLVSHQLRTPLSGTKWLIETMQRGVIGETNQKEKEYLNSLYQINERMISLVSDILNILTLESGVIVVKKEKVSVLNLYKDLLLTMEPVAKSKNITIKNLIQDSNECFVKSNFLILRTILENFISNSISYSASGEEIIIDVIDNPDELVFCIKDNGIGIPKEEQ